MENNTFEPPSFCGFSLKLWTKMRSVDFEKFFTWGTKIRIAPSSVFFFFSPFPFCFSSITFSSEDLVCGDWNGTLITCTQSVKGRTSRDYSFSLYTFLHCTNRDLHIHSCANMSRTRTCGDTYGGIHEFAIWPCNFLEGALIELSEIWSGSSSGNLKLRLWFLIINFDEPFNTLIVISSLLVAESISLKNRKFYSSGRKKYIYHTTAHKQAFVRNPNAQGV